MKAIGSVIIVIIVLLDSIKEGAEISILKSKSRGCPEFST